MPYIDFKQLETLEAAIDKKAGISWHSAGLSHTGRVRKANEDAFYHSAEQGIWVVADGMGGLARGDYAAGVVVESFVHFCKSSTLAASIRDLEMRLREAHNNCRNSFKDEHVGSTVVAILSYGQYGFFLWAGDSRIYRLRGDELKLMTTDHTVAQQKYARGEISAERVARHPGAHVLTRAVGVHQTLHLDLDYAEVESGDRFLLCSDGLYNEMPRDEIRQHMHHDDAEKAAEALVQCALDKGGKDNITAIVVDAL